MARTPLSTSVAARGRRRSGTRGPGPHPWVLPVVALGGMLGASARFALERGYPVTSGSLPWATLTINLSGCALIGVLMVHVTELGGAHPLLRPFLGVGVLGGFTTFSTYAVQTHALLLAGHPRLALVYLVGTAVLALVAVGLGVGATRAAVRTRRWLARARRSAREDSR